MGSSRRVARLSAGGFTLIELVLSMALVAIVGVSLYASLKQAFSLAADADRVVEPTRTAELAMELVSEDFDNAVSPNATNNEPAITVSTSAENISSLTGITGAGSTASTTSNTTSSTASASSASGTTTGWLLAGPFEGTQSQSGGNEADDLVFFSTSDGFQHVDGTGEIKMIEITIDTPKGASSPCLVRKVTSNLMDETLMTPDEEIVCRGVTGLTLQYFDGQNWNPTWDSTAEDNTLPVAIQMTMTLARPGASGQTRTLSYQRVFVLPCSTAEQDSTVNTAVATQ